MGFWLVWNLWHLALSFKILLTCLVYCVLALSLSHLVILIYNKPPPNQHYIMFIESVGQELAESTAGMSSPHHVWGLSCDDSLQRETQKAGICFQGGYLTRPVAPCQAGLEGWAQLHVAFPAWCPWGSFYLADFLPGSSRVRIWWKLRVLLWSFLKSHCTISAIIYWSRQSQAPTRRGDRNSISVREW